MIDQIGHRLLVFWVAMLLLAAEATVYAQILHPTEPMPSYEVATIKPCDGNGVSRPIRLYIQAAFNIESTSRDRLIGPDWIDSKCYVIRGKLPDSTRDAMRAMSRDELTRETELIGQSLLVDRFNLKVHFETREMPVFELVLGKGGSKLKEVPSIGRDGATISNKGNTAELKGSTASIATLVRSLMGSPEVDGRAVLDKTGLTGTYDILMDWTTARPSAPPLAESPSPDAAGPSLFTALQEQLGLKLVPTKGPVEVVVIDHIEPPSEN